MSLTHNAARTPVVAAGYSTAARNFLVVFALALFLLPAVVVLPGALRSNGSPAVLLALISAALVGIAFIAGRVKSGADTGAVGIVVTGTLTLTTSAAGLIRPLDALTRAGVIRGLLSLLGYTGIALLSMLTMRRRRDRHAVLVAVWIGLTFSGVVGILQSSTSSDLRYVLKPPGFVLNRDFEAAVRAGYTRALGTSDSPIELAVLMACLIAISMYFLRADHTTYGRTLGVIGTIVGLLGIPASLSRTGIVCLIAVGLVLVLASTVRQALAGIVTAGLVIAGYALLVPSRADDLLRLFTRASSDNSITGRTDDYGYVFDRFREAPIFGSGLGTSLPSNTRFLDNQWLQSVVQGGVIGFTALLLLFATAAAGCVGGARQAGNRRDRNEFITYGAVVAAAFAGSFTFDLFAFQQVKLLFVLVIGLAFAAHRDPSHGGQRLPAENGFRERLR